jgi:hypothetical protein
MRDRLAENQLIGAGNTGYEKVVPKSRTKFVLFHSCSDLFRRVHGDKIPHGMSGQITEKKGAYVAFDRLRYTPRSNVKIDGPLPLDQHMEVRILRGQPNSQARILIEVGAVQNLYIVQNPRTYIYATESLSAGGVTVGSDQRWDITPTPSREVREDRVRRDT